MMTLPWYPLAVTLAALPVSHYQPGPVERLQQQFETYYLETVPDAADAIEARFAELSRQARETRDGLEAGAGDVTSISAPQR